MTGSKTNSLSPDASNALGIEAASFCSAAEKDIAESPAALPNAQKKTENLKLTFQLSIFNFQLKKNL